MLRDAGGFLGEKVQDCVVKSRGGRAGRGGEHILDDGEEDGLSDFFEDFIWLGGYAVGAGRGRGKVFPNSVEVGLVWVPGTGGEAAMVLGGVLEESIIIEGLGVEDRLPVSVADVCHFPSMN